MKTVIIISIAVVVSVVAVFAIFIGIDRYHLYSREQTIAEYNKEIEPFEEHHDKMMERCRNLETPLLQQNCIEKEQIEYLEKIKNVHKKFGFP